MLHGRVLCRWITSLSFVKLSADGTFSNLPKVCAVDTELQASHTMSQISIYDEVAKSFQSISQHRPIETFEDRADLCRASVYRGDFVDVIQLETPSTTRQSGVAVFEDVGLDVFDSPIQRIDRVKARIRPDLRVSLDGDIGGGVLAAPENIAVSGSRATWGQFIAQGKADGRQYEIVRLGLEPTMRDQYADQGVFSHILGAWLNTFQRV